MAKENKGTSILNFFSAQYPSFKPSLYNYIIVSTETINLVLLTISLNSVQRSKEAEEGTVSCL